MTRPSYRLVVARDFGGVPFVWLHTRWYAIAWLLALWFVATHPCGEADVQRRDALPPPCTCFAAPGAGHAIGCARVLGDDPRREAA